MLTGNNSETSSYLKPGRLGEVLALIQVLAYDKDTSRSEEGIGDELQRIPSSADTWMELAEFHPELFRVRANEKRKKRAALVARYVLPYEALDNGEEKRPQLEPSVVNKLMEVAIDMHDRQVNRKNQWKILVPMVVAIISATAAIVAALI
jgi:hypothetical protein